MIQRGQIVFPSKTGAEERAFYVYLPSCYKRERERRFPVLYMFDGQNVFFDSDATYGKSWGLQQYLDWTKAPLIVAAVACNQNPDNGRLREYSPYSFEDAEIGKVTGSGEKTLRWFVRNFKPLIDRKYRTLPDREHTWIAGSSMGGLMSLYAVLRHNNIFSRAAALSPSIWTSRKKMLSLAYSARVQKDTIIYMDYGSEEFNYRTNMRAAFSEMTAALLQKELFLTGRIVPGGTHCEASWERQLPFMMETLLYGMEDD